MSEPTRPILLTNFRLFDGRSPTLWEGRRLVIDDGRVSAVVTGDAAAPEGARVIDCNGRVVMPGLIDAHWHSVFAALPISSLFAADTSAISSLLPAVKPNAL